MANQRMKLALGIDDGNQTILRHGTKFLVCPSDCQQEAVEKICEAEGTHKTTSLLDEQGTMEEGMDSFSISRSGELAIGHRQLPLTMIFATLASRRSPES